MKVGFFQGHLSERGTSIAIFDYAKHNIEMLGNESYIYYVGDHSFTHPGMVGRFHKEFENIYEVKSFRPEAEKLFVEHEIDVVYIPKAGYPSENGIDRYVSDVCRTAVHCIFSANSPHGDAYAAISQDMPGGSNVDIVPHMIDLPDVDGDMREELGIPEDATVFAGYGCKDCFSINWVKDVVKEVLDTTENIYFLFANFNKFVEHERAIFLPCITGLHEKVRFINTSDAMLHARIDGETFGLSIAEFSIKNKPVFTTPLGSPAHMRLLGSKAIIYLNAENLKRKILGFDRKEVIGKDWNAYRDYSPEKVMSKFKKVFLDV